MSHECIPLSEEARWREALRGIPHDFGHTWECAHALSLTAGPPTFLYNYRDGDVRIVAPLCERVYDGYLDVVTPPGFSGFVGSTPFPGFPQRWAEFAAERGYIAGYIGLNPVLYEPSYAPPDQVHEHNGIYMLDLSLSPDELRARMDRNRRRQLRDWAATSDTLFYGRELLAAFLTHAYPAFLHAIGASTAYDRSRETLEYLCGLDDVFAVGTRDATGVTSAYIFAFTETVATCLINVAHPEARPYATALLWRGVEFLQERGVPVLNMGGGTRENDAVAQAKQRFGGTRVPLRSLRQIYRPDVYARLCEQAAVDPHDVSGYFPAYRAQERPADISNLTGDGS